MHRFFNHNLKKPRYANTGAFQIDTIQRTVFKNRILPYFKDKPVNAITPTDIRAWQNEQIDKGYSDAYLDRIQNMLTTILNYAVTYYNLPSNPCTRAGHMSNAPVP